MKKRVTLLTVIGVLALVGLGWLSIRSQTHSGSHQTSGDFSLQVRVMSGQGGHPISGVRVTKFKHEGRESEVFGEEAARLIEGLKDSPQSAVTDSNGEATVSCSLEGRQFYDRFGLRVTNGHWHFRQDFVAVEKAGHREIHKLSSLLQGEQIPLDHSRELRVTLMLEVTDNDAGDSSE